MFGWFTNTGDNFFSDQDISLLGMGRSFFCIFVFFVRDYKDVCLFIFISLSLVVGYSNWSKIDIRNENLQ